jgi:hypothetical protein
MKDRNGTPGAGVAIRRSGGIALEEIAESTRINVYYLRVIERGEIDLLPGGIYNTSRSCSGPVARPMSQLRVPEPRLRSAPVATRNTGWGPL